MRGKGLIGLVLMLAAAAFAAPASAADFNTDWSFQRDGGATERVVLPHTPKIEPRIVNDQWQGAAVYRKTFKTDAEWSGQRVLLRFEAAMNIATVSFNGKELTKHLGGYLPFTVDLTPGLRADGGDNVLTVELDNTDSTVTGPKPLKSLDFNTYGGLYRGVRLIVKPPVYITDEIMAGKVAGGGVFITYPRVDAKEAVVAVKTEVANTAAEARRVTVVQTLWNGAKKAGEIVQSQSVAAGQTITVDQNITVAKPRLWTPHMPTLYRLETRVVDGAAVDFVENRIGIRRIEITRDSFKINGEAMKPRGTNRHQEYPYVGYATSPQADERDARLIKAAGFDFVRLSHYPQSPAFMKAADEIGLVLLDSILGWQYQNDTPAFKAQVVQTCRDMIRRDRNHPSVIAWECSLNETRMPADLLTAFHNAVHEEYPGDQAWSAGWVPEVYDIYIEARQHRLPHPEIKIEKPYIVSEYGDWEYYAGNAGLNQTAWADLKQDDRTSRQDLASGEKRLLQQATNLQEAHNDNFTTPAFADAFWVMFDYNRGYAKDLETSGIASIERAPKFSYYLFRSQRDASEKAAGVGGPMVFIASYWNAQSTPKVRVFSNADEVELLLNGKRIARQKPDADKISDHLAHPPFTFDVGAFTPGTLEARAYIKGKVVARHSVKTAGAPAALQVKLDDMGVAPVPGDVVFVRAQVLDAVGTPVPVSGVPVSFTASDGYSIVGATEAMTEAGLASILVRIDGAGKGKLSATSPGLTAR